MSKLDIKKEHIGKKIYDIKFREYVTEHYRVMADDEEKAQELMYSNRREDDNGDTIVYLGVREQLDEIKTEELSLIKQDDFRQYGEEDFECEYVGGWDE